MDVIKISSELLARSENTRYPGANNIAGIIDKLRAAVFPGYFTDIYEKQFSDAQLPQFLADIHHQLSKEIKTAMMCTGTGTGAYERQCDADAGAKEISEGLLDNLTGIQQLLYKDAQAGFSGDPAAQSVNEVILTYPGFYAVFVYRCAHYLFLEKVPLIPRMMTEYAHSITGIDIHPGAEIGEHFFIDHGTGVVIGETAVIGNNVKIYQGVTIGALSTGKGQGLKNIKRHPTIEDNVTIYSGASILGGDTTIGQDAVIGGNAFIVKSVPAKTVVKMVNPELNYNDGSGRESLEFTQPDAWFYQI